MNEITLILKQHNIAHRLENDKILFPRCPICKNESQSALSERMYFCQMCNPDALSLVEFFQKLAIPYDPSETDFTRTFATHADEVFDPNRVKGISTGFTSLDEITGGLKSGHLYLLTAETGMGKSVFAINLICNLIQKDNKACSYLDLENGRLASLARFIAVAGIKQISFFETQSNKVEALQIASEFKDKLIYRDHLKLAPFTQKAGYDMAEGLAELIRNDVKEKNVSFVVIDPLENFELAEADYNAIAKVVIAFKNLAQELSISIMLLHHVRKPERHNQKNIDSLSSQDVTAPTYRIPTLYDILGSSKITNMATDVWTLVRQIHHEDVLEKGKILLRILKQREGASLGNVYLVMNMQNLKIGELSTREEYYGGQNQIEYAA